VKADWTFLQETNKTTIEKTVFKNIIEIETIKQTGVLHKFDAKLLKPNAKEGKFLQIDTNQLFSPFSSTLADKNFINIIENDEVTKTTGNINMHIAYIFYSIYHRHSAIRIDVSEKLRIPMGLYCN